VPVNQSVALAQRLRDNPAPLLLGIFPEVGYGVMLSSLNLSQLIDEMTRFIVAIESSNFY
jgi:hypothetical protein